MAGLIAGFSLWPDVKWETTDKIRSGKGGSGFLAWGNKFLGNKFIIAGRDAIFCVSTCISKSTQMGIITAGSIDQDCRIKQLSATCAFPGVEGANEVVKLFGKHATFTAWTLHKLPPDF